LNLLNNALEQTGWNGPRLESPNWKNILLERLEQLNWSNAVNDVKPFLERPAEAPLLTLAHLRQLLAG